MKGEPFIFKSLFRLCGLVIAFAVLAVQFNPSVSAVVNSYVEHPVQFTSSDQTVLHGSLLIPDGEGPYPVVILIHGAGWHAREEYRDVAEIFVKSGIAAFIYDKRIEGYSADGIGEYSRSYALLADDVLAAVEALQSWEELDPNAIGLWGLSEGASVGPLAATRSEAIAFVITVSASGITPAQQTSWAMENKFRHEGIHSKSFILAITREGMRFLVSAGMFAESSYNHVPPLEALQQPLLAIWGSFDRIGPPVENYHIMRGALERGNNGYSTFHFVPNADHDLRLSTDGFESIESFAPGYAEAMITWVNDVLAGRNKGIHTNGNLPKQDYPSPHGIAEPSWFDSVWLQLSTLLALIVLFSSYYVIALARRMRRHKANSVSTRLSWYARILSISGVSSVLGFFGYFGYIMMSDRAGFVIFGRPLPWLVLQLLSLLTYVLVLFLAISWHKLRSMKGFSENIRFGLLLIGGILFVPWAFHWHLFGF